MVSGLMPLVLLAVGQNSQDYTACIPSVWSKQGIP